MKNCATGAEDRRPEPSPAWREALALFEADPRPRGAAGKTRPAHRGGRGQFPPWRPALAAEGPSPPAAGTRASAAGGAPDARARRAIPEPALFLSKSGRRLST